MPVVTKNHDLNLPDWGPYSKDLAGVAHIPDINSGLRFDVSIVPGYFRQQMVVPNERFASGHHAWEASSDLNYYCYRYELEWKDQVYCDVSFSEMTKQSRLIRAHFVNNTSIYQNLMMHIIANMNFPPLRPDVHDVLQLEHYIVLGKVELPINGQWIDALSYEDLQFSVSRPSDNLVEDGWVRGEFRDHGLIDGVGVGQGFARDNGDKLIFKGNLKNSYENAELTLRYRLPENGSVILNTSGLTNKPITLGSSDKDKYGFMLVSVPVGNLESGKYELILTSTGGAEIELDGFAILDSNVHSELSFSFHYWNPVPEIIKSDDEQSMILKYPDCDTYYGLAWKHDNVWIREFQTDHLNTQLRFMVPNNYTSHINDGGSKHYSDTLLRPLEMTPESELTQFAMNCSGTQEEVLHFIEQFGYSSDNDLETIYSNARGRTLKIKSLPDGETYRFSQERMAATEMLNVVYPTYTRRQFIRSFCPGKWWDSLYTWDAGFIGLALLEYDTKLCAESLDAYLCDDGDDHCAFINHGSLIATQAYQFLELWNRTQDKTMLSDFYPKLRHYYKFMAGYAESSTLRDLQSNLIRTWEIFRWDSGGWDDYPAQINTIENDLDDFVSCCAVTAHVIRFAKILKMAAIALGESDDLLMYDNDIQVLGDSLQTYAWDEKAGYFSYVIHNEEGKPVEHMKTSDGINFNMGLDGIMPLFAGICTPDQEALFLQRLQDPKRYWTKIGLSTVDQTAPYYRHDGYWNGAVWMPHQWFIWKTALDMGNGEFAYQIAHTALNLWKAEVEASYYCFEHFLIESGRGAGWHQFGALSSPVVSWFNAYYKPGNISNGMDVWIDKKSFSDDLKSMTAELTLAGDPKTVTVIVNLEPSDAYNVIWCGKILDFRQRHAGCIEIEIPFESSNGLLEITSNKQ